MVRWMLPLCVWLVTFCTAASLTARRHDDRWTTLGQAPRDTSGRGFYPDFVVPAPFSSIYDQSLDGVNEGDQIEHGKSGYNPLLNNVPLYRAKTDYSAQQGQAVHYGARKVMGQYHRLNPKHRTGDVTKHLNNGRKKYQQSDFVDNLLPKPPKYPQLVTPSQQSKYPKQERPEYATLAPPNNLNLKIDPHPKEPIYPQYSPPSQLDKTKYAHLTPPKYKKLKYHTHPPNQGDPNHPHLIPPTLGLSEISKYPHMLSSSSAHPEGSKYPYLIPLSHPQEGRKKQSQVPSKQYFTKEKSIEPDPGAAAKQRLLSDANDHIPSASHKNTWSQRLNTIPNYSFKWHVQDVNTGTDFGHSESRVGEDANGQYNTLLPDGRVQVVKYTVKGDNGYVAKVSYHN